MEQAYEKPSYINTTVPLSSIKFRMQSSNFKKKRLQNMGPFCTMKQYKSVFFSVVVGKELILKCKIKKVCDF